MGKRECNVCYKPIKSPVKCFLSKSCDWVSCGSCVNKQVKLKDNYDVCYKCPNCRSESIFNKHSKITKYVKSSRGTLNQVIKLQRVMLQKQEEKINEIHSIVSAPVGIYIDLTGLEPEPDIEDEPNLYADTATNASSPQEGSLQQNSI